MRRQFGVFPGTDRAGLIGAAGDSKVGRYLAVGTPAVSTWRRMWLVTTPGFPVAYKAEAEKRARPF